MATEAEKKAIRSAAAKKGAETRRQNRLAEQKRADSLEGTWRKPNTSSARDWNWLWILGIAAVVGLIIWNPLRIQISRPTATSFPTEPAPVVQPTEAPAVQPTEAPVVQPTEAPVVQPTEAPIVNEPVVAAPVQVCPDTTEQAKQLFGVSVQRIDTESCGWVWRGKPSSHTALCPAGYICTWDVVGDITVVHLGINQQADIYAGTWRLISAYPADDAVNNVCELYLKEKDFASREVPSFEVRFQPVPDLGPQTCP